MEFKHLTAALFAGFALQSLLLPCLCSIGTAKIALAYSFDGIVLIRMLVAYFLQETGRGWFFYTLLCYTSVAWVEAASWLLLGRH